VEPLPPPDVEKLAHDVEDRPAREGENEGLRRAGDPEAPDDRAHERRPSADQAEEAEEAPGGPLSRERPRDPEPFGRVVEPEADHERERERDGSRRPELADGQAFAEVVDATSAAIMSAVAGDSGIPAGSRAPGEITR
jgi:hypothetical protein